MCLWLIRTFSQILSSGKPTLIITQQGIRVDNIYPVSEIVLPWEEIEAIFPVRNGIEQNLAICPKKVALSRFSPPMRFRLRFNMMSKEPSVIIAQALLENPVKEILRQLWAQFEQELERYHVQLAPP